MRQEDLNMFFKEKIDDEINSLSMDYSVDNILNKEFDFIIHVTNILYYNEETSYCILLGYSANSIPFYNKKKNKFEIFNRPSTESSGPQDEYNRIYSLVGRMQEITVDCDYKVKGILKYNQKYGYQYEPKYIIPIVPLALNKSKDFLNTFVRSDLVDNLLEVYPNIVEEIVNGTRTDINVDSIKGLGIKTWGKIKDKILKNYIMADILIMLNPLGITFNMISKLMENSKNPVLLKKTLEENPYILTNIKGLGFTKIDQMVLKIHPELKSSLQRLNAYINYYLTLLGEQDGHTLVTIDALKIVVLNNVPDCINFFEQAIESTNFLYHNDKYIGLSRFRNVELKIFELLNERKNYKSEFFFSEDDKKRAIKIAEQEQGFTYTEEQVNTICSTLDSSISFIPGKAGVGKSSIMRGVLKAYKLKGYSISSSALSALAAIRIQETTGCLAKTIHRTLGLGKNNESVYNSTNPMPCDVAFLDEGSMVNAVLFLQWLSAIGPHTNIIISGDYKQLPPIGFGNIFSDLCNVFDKKYIHELTKPMRQAMMSGILSDANLIRDNKNPIIEKKMSSTLIHGELKDMYYMFRDNRQSLFNIATKTYLHTIETQGTDDVVLIVPRKQNCINSTFELNKYIQNSILGNQKIEIEKNKDISFKLGAKVRQTENDYDRDVFNGDVGYINEIDTRNKTCTVIFKDNLSKSGIKTVLYTKSQLQQIDLAYALTVHSCQGNGFKTIIGIIDNTHFKLLDNCMLYTLLTRAKKRGLLLAEPSAFKECIRTSHNKRHTWLDLINDSEK